MIKALVVKRLTQNPETARHQEYLSGSEEK